MVVATLLRPASAEEAGDCRDAADPRIDLRWARVVGAARQHFSKDASDLKECPAASARCEAKAFVVAGDHVVAGRAHGAFTCVSYVGRTGDARTGWLPSAAISPEPAGVVAPDGWLGTWSMTESEISIARGKGGMLTIRGDATYGALDPERVKRGAVNVGEIEASTAPAGSRLAFGMGDTATVPVDKVAEGACQVWMQRIGPYLAVRDNYSCGGMNVTFTGLYRRRP